MSPPARKTCDYPGCNSTPPETEGGQPTPFVTSVENTTKKEVNDEMDKHVERAHILPIRLAENATKAREAEARNREAEAQVIQAEAAKIKETTQQILATQQNSRSSSPATNPDASSDTAATATSASVITNLRPRQQDKRDALPRPTIEENCSVTDWGFFGASGNVMSRQQASQRNSSCTTYGLPVQHRCNVPSTLEVRT